MTIHRRDETCPLWCHLCPHMHGQVMPYCYGSVCRNIDEFDLTNCTCTPCDPVVAHLELINKTETLLRHLREARRIRNLRRSNIDRLRQLALAMTFNRSLPGHRQAWEEVASIAGTLRAEIVSAVQS